VTMAASAGGVGIRDAAEQLKRSIAIFDEIGNDVELARSCRASSELLRGTPGHATDHAVAAEAQILAKRADEIQAKMHAQALAKEKEQRAEQEGAPANK
jgi:hypothetical protein